MVSISPFLWFPHSAEEALNYYQDNLPGFSFKVVSRSPEGTLFSADCMFLNQRVMVINGGNKDEFNPSFSWMITCSTQEELDQYYDALLVNGKELRCGWLTDQFGLTWQVIPDKLGEWLNHPDKEIAEKMRQQMMQLQKLNFDAFLSVLTSK